MTRAMTSADNTASVVLLRHGAVASHRGDVELTREGRHQAELAGRWLAGWRPERVVVLAGPTLRAHQTAFLLVHGLTDELPSVPVGGPDVCFALRNPDLYLAGRRVDPVSTAAAFAAQVPGATEADVAADAFFSTFLDSPDRIGLWLHHPHPPGETAQDVGQRVALFVAGLHRALTGNGWLVVGVTHSPVLRAVVRTFCGSDPGEPGHLTGYRLCLNGPGLALAAVDPK